MGKKLKIVFMGTSLFAVPVLEKLLETQYDVSMVFTRKDSPKGRGMTCVEPPVKQFICGIAGKKIRVFQPEKLKDSSMINEVKEASPDLIVVAAYGILLPREFLNIPAYGCLNIHPSLLPKYRGASPIQAAILNRDAQTGVSIIKMNERMDAGDIVAQKTVAISSQSAYPAIERILSQQSAELLVKTIPNYVSGKIIPRAQKENLATYTPLILKRDGLINWSDPASSIEAKIRAFEPWPGAYFFFQSKNKKKNIRVEIISAEISPKGMVHRPGFVFFDKSSSPYPLVSTGKGSLSLKTIKPEGKKTMNSLDFINGYPDFTGTQL